MQAQEKTWKEQIWEEKDQRNQWKEYHGVVVLDKVVAEEASKLVVERVSGKKMVAKAVVEAEERIQNKQIQVSNFGLLWILSEVNSVV